MEWYHMMYTIIESVRLGSTNLEHNENSSSLLPDSGFCNTRELHKTMMNSLCCCSSKHECARLTWRLSPNALAMHHTLCEVKRDPMKAEKLTLAICAACPLLSEYLRKRKFNACICKLCQEHNEIKFQSLNTTRQRGKSSFGKQFYARHVSTSATPTWILK